MNNFFNQNLQNLSKFHTQKVIADKTGFSQSSINNYIAGTSEPSIKFLIKLKEAFDINIEEFLFSYIDYKNTMQRLNINRFTGNYICYYYNNSAYKGDIHNSISALNYGVISIVNIGGNALVYGTFTKNKKNAIKSLETLNRFSSNEEIIDFHNSAENVYAGKLNSTNENIFIELECKEKEDKVFMILKNPPSSASYIGGIATMNSVARGREHNPCVQYILTSKKVVNQPDGEIYNLLSMGNVDVDLTNVAVEIVELFKNLYIVNSQLSTALDENQKINLIENKLKYHFDIIVEANEFRYGKISNREDDDFYQLIKEEMDNE